jgi:hypothetical protein
LEQCVRGPTHKGGHTLDLILIRARSLRKPSAKVLDLCLSDHSVCTL